MRYYKEALMTGLIFAFMLTTWWVYLICATWPDVDVPCSWEIDGPPSIYLYMDNLYQIDTSIEINKLENQQAADFFSVPHRNPFEQLTYRRESI